MSTPKFLTWSKGQKFARGDSKHVSSGIVPIPIECISFKGMDYGRSERRLSRMKRRPIPLEFEKPERSNSNSFALHDAAIKSATTLMAVMNDVLQSPHLTAHFHSQQSGGLQPTPQGRPRSRTAPSTPMFEATGVEPVELPGSTPIWPKFYPDGRCSMDAVSSKRESAGRSIERPRSSPQHSSHAFQDDYRRPTLSTSRSASSIRISANQATHNGRCSTSSERQSSSSGPAQLAPEKFGPSTTLSTTHGAAIGLPSTYHGDGATLHGTETIDKRPQVQTNKYVSIREGPPQPKDLEALLEQVSAMRKSYNAHVLSLKREVESHKSYIAFLESCPTSTVESRDLSKPDLTLDTFHITGKISGPSSKTVSASTSLQSLDSTLEAPSRASVESAAAEAEALKRKLSLCRKTQSELGDVRRERDHFREANDRGERRIGQLKDLIRESKDKDIAMNNKVQGLEAALLAANIQRIDVLEGYREACEQVQKLHDKQLLTIRERDEALEGATIVGSDRRVSASNEERKYKIAAESSSYCVQTEHAATLRQLEDLHRLILEKDSRICQLEAERQNLVPKSEIIRLEKQLIDAEAIRDQYNALLHTELRRQTKNIAFNTHAATPQVKDEAAATVVERLNSKPGSEIAEKRCELLERELTHCFSEIILYKLDIRGYRKDLKEANAKIEGLQQARPHRPETPDSMKNIYDEKSASHEKRRRTTSVLGLGITQRTSTPTRTSVSRLSTPQHSRALAAPSSSASTPLELDKQLPKPPSASPYPSPTAASPPTATELSRAETVRSLSESIISSYAKRATPEQDHGHVPLLFRGPSSDLPRSGELRVHSYRAIDAIAVPISRYTPDMLKTPDMARRSDVSVGKRECVR